MSQNSAIQWTHHTLNFWWGCTKVSPACEHCYAETVSRIFSKRHFGRLVKWGKGQERGERLEAARKQAITLNASAAKRGVRERVFVNSMSDWLDAEVPIEWLCALLETIFLCPQLDFQLLTKRPENWEARIFKAMLCAEKADPSDTMPYREGTFCEWIQTWETSDPPPNVWIGTTVENQHYADTRIPDLLKIPARVRFLSCEPLLGPVDIARCAPMSMDGDESNPSYLNGFNGVGHHPLTCVTTPPIEASKDGIHWVIAGGESGSHARPSHPFWLRTLRDQCQTAHVPFFFKQWGEWIPAGERTPTRIPEDTKLQGYTFTGKTEAQILCVRLGVSKTGALLDGREWHEFPASTIAAPTHSP